MSHIDRVILVVLDSVGIGELPDAARYGDEGSDTLGNICRQVDLHVPNLQRLGLGNIRPLRGVPRAPMPAASFGRMAEASPGKDSVTGHWEIAGIVLDRPFPTFPHGLSAEVIEQFERAIGRQTLGNEVASGTEIIERLGDAHVASGKPIVYTSADSVFQIAAHEDVVPVPELYRMCEAAYRIVVDGLGVGRVIARPFVGPSGAYARTANRHDYAMPSPEPTLLDRLIDCRRAGRRDRQDRGPVRGPRHHPQVPTPVRRRRRRRASSRRCATTPDGLIFANLVDFDTKYGHRNDVAGLRRTISSASTGGCRRSWPRRRQDDLLVITADHGNDPTTPSTDHSREYVPVLAACGLSPATGSIWARATTFADLGQTVADVFGVGPLPHGTSFLTSVCL